MRSRHVARRAASSIASAAAAAGRESSQRGGMRTGTRSSRATRSAFARAASGSGRPRGAPHDPAQVERPPLERDAQLRDRRLQPPEHPVRHVADGGGEVVVDGNAQALLHAALEGTAPPSNAGA